MARPQEVVLDASIVAKWLVSERDSNRAVAIRDAHVEGRLKILAPELLWYEVANVVRHSPGVRPDLLHLGLKGLADAQLAIYRPTAASIERAASLALRTGLTVYDACYASLAEDHNCPLVTEDRELLRTSARAVSLESWSVPVQGRR